MDVLMEGWHLSCEPRGLWVHRGLGRGNGWGQAVGQWLVLEEEQRRPRQFSHGVDVGRAEREVREATGAYQTPCLDVRIYFYPRWWGGLWRVFSGEVTWYDIHLKRSTLSALLKIHKGAGGTLRGRCPTVRARHGAGGEKWPTCGSIWKVELSVFGVGLDLGLERKSRSRGGLPLCWPENCRVGICVCWNGEGV